MRNDEGEGAGRSDLKDFPSRSFTENELKKILESAISSFKTQDIDLLCVRSSERSMCHKLAEHLQRGLPQWHVDCEYNREKFHPKRIKLPRGDKERSVYPDIVVHKRGTNQNILIIEAKCSDSTPTQIDHDVEKLKTYIETFCYLHAALVTFVIEGKFDVNFEFVYLNR
jgi:hypothetical protein